MSLEANSRFHFWSAAHAAKGARYPEPIEPLSACGYTVETAMNGKRKSVPRSAAARDATGFTLIELAVTVAVLAILLAIAAPSFETMTNQNRLVSASHQVVATLQTARMEAIRQNRRVMICDSRDGSQCQCCERRWNGILLAQPDGDNSSRSLAFTTLKSSVVEFSPSAAFNNRDWENKIAYGADGRPVQGTSLLQRPVTMRVCIPTTRPASNIRDVVLHVNGRVEVTAVDGGGGCPLPGS